MVFFIANLKSQALALHSQMQNVGSLELAFQGKMILVDQIKERGLALVFDLRAQPDPSLLLKKNAFDSLAVAAADFRHEGFRSRAAG